jgi:hypothetical protein
MYHEAKEKLSAVGNIVKWVRNIMAMQTLMGIFIALWLKLFFRSLSIIF